MGIKCSASHQDNSTAFSLHFQKQMKVSVKTLSLCFVILAKELVENFIAVHHEYDVMAHSKELFPGLVFPFIEQNP